VSRRIGCSSILGLGCLAPGLTLIGFGVWVSQHGQARFIILAGIAWLVIGGSLFAVQASAAGLFRKKPDA
jgi:glucose dehydrogenase